MKDLTVFVLTHNRGEMLLETIDSILNQSCHDFKFIVSDNSSNDETMRLLEERGYLGKFEYRKRDKEYPSMEHFNLCLSEVDTTYFVLFHDDDIMLQDYVETMYNSIAGSEYVAVGCNAYYLYGDKQSRRKFFKWYRNDFSIISSDKDLALRYCKKNGNVPFPSYMYGKKLIGTEIFDDECGKYSDVSWLLRLAKIAPINWLSAPLMYYRIHKGQDSQSFDIRNQKKLLSKLQGILGAENKYVINYNYNLIYLDIIATYRREYVFDKIKFAKLVKLSKKYSLKTILKLLQIKLLKQNIY
jgi:glycosyltransferase involved in cell wall biosynthesis